MDYTRQDSYWGWVIVAASFITLTVLSGTMLASFSVLYNSFIVQFDSRPSTVGWVMSIGQFSCFTLAALLSPLIDKYGIRRVAIAGVLINFLGTFTASAATGVGSLCLTYGLVAGIGCGMCTLSSILIPQQYFLEKRALAGGLATTGWSLGQFIFAPLTQLLLENYGWRGTLVILSAFNLQLLPIVTLLKSANVPIEGEVFSEYESLNEQNEENVMKDTRPQVTVDRFIFEIRQMFDMSLLRNHKLCLYLIGTFLANVGTSAITGQIVARSSEIGLNGSSASLVGSCIGIGGVVCRLFMLIPLSTSRLNLMLAYTCGFILGGILLISLICVKSFTGSCLITTLYGASYGIWVSVQITALRDLVGLHNLTRSSGFMLTGVGVIMLVTLPFSGWLHELGNSYDISFAVVGSIQLLGGLFIVVVCVIQWIEKPHNLPIATHDEYHR